MCDSRFQIIRSIRFVVILGLAIMIPFRSSLNAQDNQMNADQLLLEIMDLHSELTSNKDFLAQATMLGAYLQAAQSSDF